MLMGTIEAVAVAAGHRCNTLKTVVGGGERLGLSPTSVIRFGGSLVVIRQSIPISLVANSATTRNRAP